jgi:hypothetical protein
VKANQIENLILLLIVALFVGVIWAILYHPEWLMRIVTYRG